jgi:hypothetical protein
MKIHQNHSISKELWQAYEETEFKVYSDNSFTLKIGNYSDELNSLINESKCLSAAFITAYNPFSKQLSESENSERQDGLRQELAKRGLKCYDGVGQHPSGQWPGEPSLLILGLSKEAALALARNLEQNAFVWSDSSAVPQLISALPN